MTVFTNSRCRRVTQCNNNLLCLWLDHNHLRGFVPHDLLMHNHCNGEKNKQLFEIQS